jgi:DNA invertase Pin-like site-specific DNA recombinase
MKGQIVGYARVSSADQNLARQLEQLKSENTDKIFEDKASGATTKRPAFQQMMEYIREGDTIVVCSMDRLARNLTDLLNTTKELQAKGVSIRFIKESILLDASGNDVAMTKLLMSMLGAVAEFERSMIRERQREGIELAKKRGVYKGRKPTDVAIIEKAREQINLGIPLAKVAREIGIARSTLYRRLQQMEQQKQPLRYRKNEA